MTSTYFYQLIVQTKYSRFYYPFSQYAVFSFLVMLVSLTSFFTLIIRGGRRIKFSELEAATESKSKNGKGKGGKGNSSASKSSKDLEKGKKKNNLIQEEDSDDERRRSSDEDD